MKKIIEAEKPTYNKHKNADWSGVYYGESLIKFFPVVPNSQSCQGHWYFGFKFVKYHPLIDVYVQYIKNDLRTIGLSDMAKFYKKKKVSLNVFVRRLFYVKEYLKYFSFKETAQLLFEPAYMEIRLY